MPAAPPLLAHGRVLGATDRHASAVADVTNITADAFADIVGTTLFDLFRQERIGDRGPRRADEIDDAALDLADHGIRRGKAADRHHRFGGHRFDVSHVGLERGFLDEPRGPHFIRIVGDVDVPQVGKLGQQPQHVAALAMHRLAVLANPFVGGESDRDGAGVAHRLFRLLDQFANQTRAVFQRTAILVGAGIEARRQHSR